MDLQPDYARKGYENNLEKQRKEAWCNRDALTYCNLTDELGFEAEDKLLYEQGQVESSNHSYKSSKLENQVDRGYDLEVVSRIALKRFPECQGRENISNKEISQRLNELKQAGYDVPAHNRLNRDEKWDLLRFIRSDLGKKLREEMPDVSNDIERRNQKHKDDADWFR